MNSCYQAVLLGVFFEFLFGSGWAEAPPLLRNGDPCDTCRVGTVEWVQEALGVLHLHLQVRASWVPPLGCPSSSKHCPYRFFFFKYFFH